MKNLLIFSGTTEGRLLAERLEDRYCVTVSVATGYGRELADAGQVVAGRMDCAQMVQLMKEKKIDIVADATHPYAREATTNIRAAAEQAGAYYLRIVRRRAERQGVTVVNSAGEAAALLQQREGNVLLTTGSKELDIFATVKDYRERLYPRILPVVGSVGRCCGLGYEVSHIIAMQGPFSRELNVALMRQFQIRILVTKDSGPEGGMEEKLEAARELGAEVILIERPEEKDGMTLEEALARLEEMA